MDKLLKYVLVVLAFIVSVELLWADCYVETVSDTIVKLDTRSIQRADTIVRHDTCVVLLQPISAPCQFDWLCDLLLPLIFGILASVLSVFVISRLLRAKISLSDKLVQTKDGKIKLQINNEHKRISLSDIHIEVVFWREDTKTKQAFTRTITMNQSDVSVLFGKRKGYNKSSYIIRSASEVKWDTEGLPYQAIRCRVIATNSLSGVRDVFEKMYQPADIIAGEFIDRNQIKPI